MRKQVLKNSFFFVFCLFLLGSCNNEKKPVSGSLPTEPLVPGSEQTPVIPAYIYAGSFNVVNSNVYESLLTTCSRCGEKRLISTPFGDHYERHWSLGDSVKACKNWLREGFLQLDFAKRTLPSPVKILIQPKYFTSSGKKEGYPFEVSSTAEPINENKGFEIIVSPNQGLKGIYDMVISSNSTNPYEYSNLSVSIKYGSSSQVLAQFSIKEYTARWKTNQIYTCDKYPPDIY